MPLPRNYLSTAKPRFAVAGIDAAQTTYQQNWADSGTWPTYPRLVAFERGTPNEELMLETAGTNVTSTEQTITVVRGFDNTTARSHPAGCKVEHVTAAVDFRQFRDGTHELDNNDPLGVAASRLPHSYPRGYSRHYVTETMGYPSAWGTVETFGWGGDTVQRYTSFLDTQVWVRTAGAGSNSWKPWRLQGGSHLSEMMTVMLATPGMAAPGLMHYHGAAAVHPAQNQLYTVPAGKFAVVKKIKIGRWGDLGAQDAGISYINVAGPGGFGHIGHVHLRKSESTWWDTAVVLGPGETFGLSDGHATSINFHFAVVEFDQAIFPVHKFFGAGLGAASFRRVYTNPDSHVITSVMVRNYTQSPNQVTLGQGGFGASESYTIPPDTTVMFEPLIQIPAGDGLYVANSSDCYVHAYGYKKTV